MTLDVERLARLLLCFQILSRDVGANAIGGRPVRVASCCSKHCARRGQLVCVLSRESRALELWLLRFEARLFKRRQLRWVDQWCCRLCFVRFDAIDCPRWQRWRVHRAARCEVRARGRMMVQRSAQSFSFLLLWRGAGTQTHAQARAACSKYSR
jgi:hypothetical protein